MESKMKKRMILGAVLLAAGLIIMALALGASGIEGLETAEYATNTYEIADGFRDIAVRVHTADVSLMPSDSGVCKVVCYEEEKLHHSVAVRDGKLEIWVEDERSWYDRIGIHFGGPHITVYLPQAGYGSLTVTGDTGDVVIPKEFGFESIDVDISTGDVVAQASSSGHIRIRTNTGDIRLKGVAAASLELTASTGRIVGESVTCDGAFGIKVSTGDVSLENIRCGSFLSRGSTGKLVMTDLIAEEKLDIRRSTGDVQLSGCDAPELFIETNTGAVAGTLLTGKRFETETSTGKVEVPQSADGGVCRITTSTGDIRIGIG